MLIIYGNTLKNEVKKKKGFWSIASDLFFFQFQHKLHSKKEREIYTQSKCGSFSKNNLVTLLNFFVYSDYWEKKLVLAAGFARNFSDTRYFILFLHLNEKVGSGFLSLQRWIFWLLFFKCFGRQIRRRGK